MKETGSRENQKGLNGSNTVRQYKSAFDFAELIDAEQKFGKIKTDMDAADKSGYTSTKPNRKKLRLSQNFKSFEEKSKGKLELGETLELYRERAIEIQDHVKGRFPFIDFMVREVSDEEIESYYEYGLFEIQIASHQGSRHGILYSKTVSKILPHYQKIIDEIYFFVDKMDLKIQIYDLLREANIVTPKGLANKNDYICHLENVEVIVKHHVEKSIDNTTSINYGSEKHNNTFQETIKKTSRTSSRDLAKTKNDFRSSEIAPKPNIIKKFTTKGKTNKEGKVAIKDLIIENDIYDIDIPQTNFFHKHPEMISLKQLLFDDGIVYIGLRPRNIFQVSINLNDCQNQITNASIKISNSNLIEELHDENRDVATEKSNSWRFDILESINFPGNYAFLAEPGVYHLKISKPGFKCEYPVIKVQKDCTFEFSMKQTRIGKLILMIIDAASSEKLPETEIIIYNQGGHIIESGYSNNFGLYEFKCEFGIPIKIFSKKSGFIDLYQEYFITPNTILNKIQILQFPILNDENKLQILAIYPRDIYNINLHILCPGKKTVVLLIVDGIIINQDNIVTSELDAVYEQYIFENSLIERAQINANTEKASKSLKDYEIIITNKLNQYNDVEKSFRNSPTTGRATLIPDAQGNISTKVSSPLSSRISTSGKMTSKPGTSRSNSAANNFSPLSQRGSKAYVEVYIK